MKIHFKVLIQIFLLVSSIFAFSFLLKSGMEYNSAAIPRKNNIMSEMVGLIWRWLMPDIPLVSAEPDSSSSYCPKTKTGEICSIFLTVECPSKCAVSCIPAASSGIHACSFGTCVDTRHGSCSIRTAKQTCDEKSGQWFDNVQGTIPQCMKGCCMLNGNPEFINEQECTLRSQSAGIRKDFRREITTQPACLVLRISNIEGACVFEKRPFNDCIVSNEQTCKTRGGKFYSRILCSNPALNTRCLPQETTKCDKTENGEDSVHWFDSCGNKENIYDFNNKAKLRQEGKIVSVSQSCQLPSPTDPSFKDKQKTCGNCAPLLGSVCGKKTGTQALVDSNMEYVCRDASCIDENGKKRVNGERWCRYQGAIGFDGQRSMDTPGSSHFLKSCQNGEVVSEVCGSNRNSICVATEAQTSSGGTFSSAQCLPNPSVLCLKMNPLKTEEDIENCEKNAFCFVKHVDVAEKFKFDVCAPKYKPGFARDDSVNENRCSMGTISCKYVKVKGLFGSKKINQECVSEKFTQQMNDLCMSLGDCGAQVNYLGDLSKSYKVVNAPELGNTYLSGISRYASERNYPGQYAPSPTLKEYFESIGYPDDIGNAEVPGDPAAGALKSGSMISGAVGTLLPLIASTSIGASALGSISLAQTVYAPGAHMLLEAGPGSAIVGKASTTLTPYGGALAGAAMGFALTSFLISWTGIGRGLPPAVTYSLLALGTLGGGIAGFGAFSAGGFATSGGSFAGGATIGGLSATVVGLVIVAIIIIAIVILKILGIGKTKTADVTFTCKPWQPPLGGNNCIKCGSDGLPCTRSACESLGQTCEFINEGTNAKGVGECVDVSPNDVTPPVINVKSITPNPYTYELKEYGAHIKGSEECITETYNSIKLEFETNEVAQCKMSDDRSEMWENMESFGTSLFVKNHTLPISVPNLESLGLPDFDPTAKANIQLHLFCQDKNGNKNSKAFTVDFCVKQGPDITSPRVVGREPSLDKIKYGAKEKEILIFTNEPADCKWAQSDSTYGSMTNEFDCANEIEDYTINGFVCNATLPTPNMENQYFVRCKDQPWYTGDNAVKRNEMSESYKFNLNKVSTPLKIDSIKPASGTVIDAESEPATVKLEVVTSGGLDGSAQCFLNYKGTKDAFTETFSTKHSKLLTYLYSGKITLPVICEDPIRNIVEGSTEFTIRIDATPPAVTRVYNKNGILHVITEKEGSCSLSTNSAEVCFFEYKNGTEMSGNSLEHTLPMPQGKISYIKCKNKFGKVAGSCSAIVQEGVI